MKLHSNRPRLEGFIDGAIRKRVSPGKILEAAPVFSHTTTSAIRISTFSVFWFWPLAPNKVTGKKAA
jgi:hypothetical protein